ncbi:MAG: triose-phosphate isomerase [Spirochaetia bacterium]|nr:triose-phosphate isomerase [Spirochaetia bacterium]
MRIPLIAGNWKMYKDVNEAVELAQSLKNVLKDVDANKSEAAVCPPAIDIPGVVSVLKGTNIRVGAQNMYAKQEGAFTGEISPLMLRSAGVHYVILGHSERREYFKESNEMINGKVRMALEYGLFPILCVGEKLEDREAGRAFDIVKAHVTGGLSGIPKEKMANVVIAYEPVWAIGTGKTATPDQAQEIHAFIRKTIVSLYDDATAQSVRIQYGGSVKPDNAKTLMGMPDIDGALVGGAALKADSFEAIVKYYK